MVKQPCRTGQCVCSLKIDIETKRNQTQQPTPGEIVARNCRKNSGPSGALQQPFKPRSAAPNDFSTGEENICICIPWGTLDASLYRCARFPIPYRGTPGLRTRPTSPCSLQQLVHNNCKFRDLQTSATPKPFELQRRPSNSSLLHINRTDNPKNSLRFGHNRAVDAHFRFRPKSAPTPNEGKPPLPLGTGGSPRPLLDSPIVSSRLTIPFAVSIPPNIAVDAFC